MDLTFSALQQADDEDDRRDQGEKRLQSDRVGIPDSVPHAVSWAQNPRPVHREREIAQVHRAGLYPCCVLRPIVRARRARGSRCDSFPCGSFLTTTLSTAPGRKANHSWRKQPAHAPPHGRRRGRLRGAARASDTRPGAERCFAFLRGVLLDGSFCLAAHDSMKSEAARQRGQPQMHRQREATHHTTPAATESHNSLFYLQKKMGQSSEQPRALVARG